MMTTFDPEAILRTLAGREDRYVLIGGLAGTLHGSPLRTNDADICPARDPDNLQRLALALEDLDARLTANDTADGVPFPHDALFLSRVSLLNLITRFGLMDVSFEPSGTGGYDDLIRNAIAYDAGVQVLVASLDDIIRSKRAANRQKDRAALPELEALRDEIRRR
jgi:hypothetical protein